MEQAVAVMHGAHSLVRCGNVLVRSVKCTTQKLPLIGKPRMIHLQTSYDSAVLTKDIGAIGGLPTDGDQWNLE